ncbi:alpha/beta hydrolase [Lutimonas saemankumensis]|uniref:alpha/beta hydrolase n=1 Tax=Lutimonas saemankumensis TaxID=483016 RepID=UPI001CD2C121|nr:alpha/beta hydrolase [Lutimonas saemankumensis]MCA0933624.1 alpha/beta hydrolase [Lutimonas saemankumensis]
MNNKLLNISKTLMKRRASDSIILLVFIFYSVIIWSQNSSYGLDTSIPYYSKTRQNQDSYLKERCVLDIYYPEHLDSFATIVWFHGGSLKAGEKEIPEALKNQNLAVVGVNYRLYPKVKAPGYIEDAAAAVAWVLKNIENYGGDKNSIFVSGHSAGGYLASMVGLDKSYLAKYDIDANQIAGLIPFSGHTITHFTVREERGIDGTQPLIDELAPLYHVRADAPPLLMITGDREKELLGRYEENAYMMRMMKVAGHKDTRVMELDGYGHGMTFPAFPLLIDEVRRIMEEKN